MRSTSKRGGNTNKGTADPGYSEAGRKLSTCIRQHTSAYVSIRQHTSAYGLGSWPRTQHLPPNTGIRQHTSAYVSIRQHTSAYGLGSWPRTQHLPPPWPVSICTLVPVKQQLIKYSSKASKVRTELSSGMVAQPVMSATLSIRQHTSAYVSTRQHTSAYVSISIRQHTELSSGMVAQPGDVPKAQHTSAYVSIRQHTSAYLRHAEHIKARRKHEQRHG
jgi:hypothetical protein